MAGAPVDDRDRAVWLAETINPTSNPEDSSATGKWSQKLATHGLPSLMSSLTELQRIRTRLQEQQSILTSKLNAQMSVAHTVVAEAMDETHKIQNDSILLRSTVNSTEQAYLNKMPIKDDQEAQALAELHRLAQVKQRMEAARDTLHAAESWSSVETEVEAHLVQCDWERAAQRLAGMEHTLSNFDSSSEYVTAKSIVLDKLLSSLDHSMAETFSDAVHERDLEALVRFARIYSTVHRIQMFIDRYISERASPVLLEWETSGRDVPALCKNLSNTIREENSVFAPKLFQDPSGSVQHLVKSILNNIPLKDLLQQMESTEKLPDLVETYAEFARLCSESEIIPFSKATADAPVSCATMKDTKSWQQTLLELFVPHQLNYAEREAAYLKAEFEKTTARFEAQRDRAFVRTADASPGSWAACIQEIATLSRDQVDTCVQQWRNASDRSQKFGIKKVVAYTAVQTSLLPAFSARLISSWEYVNARHIRHMRFFTSDPHDIVAQDMEPIPEWDVIHASLELLEIGRHLDAKLQSFYTSVHDPSLENTDTLEHAHLSPQSVKAIPLKLAHAAQNFVMMQLLWPFRRQIEAYSTHGQIFMTKTEHTTEVEVPSFSNTATEAMVKVGEGLLNLPRLLEPLVDREFATFVYAVDALPYAHGDNQADAQNQEPTTSHRTTSISSLLHPLQETYEQSNPPTYTAEHVLSLWLRSLASNLLHELVARLPDIVHDHRCDRFQLSTDLDYIATICSALNCSNLELHTWSQILNLKPADAQALASDNPLKSSSIYAQIFP
ncbi:hypothetical protein MPSI1_001024 [Malassezia psittaci]|uniref:Conserved oligomeric Golgi complex subunit 7 n=1 Tax=Malassezia psittaci TaxID=1821823 RepID=A0AAF0FCR8_9BASI|nr:hypothetical protein MPSI1_001024 [Malassezia psittaci]